MPKLGAGVYKEGVILKWAKREGDQVREGDPLVEIETEKAVMVYESPATGTVLKLLAAEGATVVVGNPIALVGSPGESITEQFSTREPEQAPALGAESSAPEKTEGGQVSAAASRLAANLNVDLSKVVGTGPGGVILREDVLKAAKTVSAETPQPQALATPSDRVLPLTTMRATIAERLSKSHREAVAVTLTREVEVAALVSLVKGAPADSFGYNDVILKAAAEALRKHPMMNSQLEGDGIRVFEHINIGVAVAVEGGLITPTLRDVDKLPLADVARLSRELSDKARKRQLTSDEYGGSTFTVSNLGAFGVEGFTPVINPPQTGILGVGRIAERAWVEAAEVRARPTVHLSVTFDHRVVDGADAAKFLDTLAGLLHDVSWIRG